MYWCGVCLGGCAGGDARGDVVDIGAGWGTWVGEGDLGIQFSPIE